MSEELKEKWACSRYCILGKPYPEEQEATRLWMEHIFPVLKKPRLSNSIFLPGYRLPVDTDESNLEYSLNRVRGFSRYGPMNIRLTDEGLEIYW